jgi:hypothetical protein
LVTVSPFHDFVVDLRMSPARALFGAKLSSFQAFNGHSLLGQKISLLSRNNFPAIAAGSCRQALETTGEILTPERQFLPNSQQNSLLPGNFRPRRVRL